MTATPGAGHYMPRPQGCQGRSAILCAIMCSAAVSRTRRRALRQRPSRTTSATPAAVSAMPAAIIGVKASPKSAQAIAAVHGGTR